MITDARIAGPRRYVPGAANLTKELDGAARSIADNPDTPHWCNFVFDHPTGAHLDAYDARLVERDGALFAYTIGTTWPLTRTPNGRPAGCLVSFTWSTDHNDLPKPGR